MAPRPFGSQLRVGVDICSISRIGGVIRRRSARPLQSATMPGLTPLLRRMFGEEERALFWHGYGIQQLRGDGSLEQRQRLVAQHLAGRWAAKEAIIKACPRKILLKDAVILQAEDLSVYGVVLDRRTAAAEPGPGPMPDFTRTKKSAGSKHLKDANDATAELIASMKHLNVAAAQRKIHAMLDGQMVPLSISHDGDYAVATCVYQAGAEAAELP